MKKLGIVAIPFLLASLSINALAESEYHLDSRTLTIPSVKIGNSHVYDAKLKLNDAGGFDIISYSDQPVVVGGTVDVKCTPDHVTLEKMNQIENGMTFDQVNNVLGCTGELRSASGSSSSYKWEGENYRPSIIIHFVSDVVFRKTFFP